MFHMWKLKTGVTWKGRREGAGVEEEEDAPKAQHAPEDMSPETLLTRTTSTGQ